VRTIYVWGSSMWAAPRARPKEAGLHDVRERVPEGSRHVTQRSPALLR
jgi:hypothetical protein